MKNPQALLFPLIATATLALTSCQEDLQPEIDRLNTQVSDLQDEITRQRERTRDEENEAEKLYAELREQKSELNQAQNELRALEREIAIYQKREEAALAAEEAKPDAKEALAAAKEKAEQHQQALVSIQGDKNSGSGVIVAANDKNWIYLSPATLSGNSRLEITQSNGTPLKKFGAFEIMKGGSIARLEITEAPEHVAPVAAPSELSSSSRLLSFGESQNLIEGRAYSVEPHLMSVDSKTSSLPAGTPVFSAEDGDLLGILHAEASGEATLWPSDHTSSRRQTNRCIRLDSETTWSTVSIGSFLEESKVLAEANQMTQLLSTFAILRPTASGINLDTFAGGGMTVKQVFEANKELSAVRSMMDLNNWLKDKGDRAAPQDINRRVNSVYSEIQRLSARQTKELSEREFSSYHAPASKLALEWRKEADEAIAKALSSLDS